MSVQRDTVDERTIDGLACADEVPVFLTEEELFGVTHPSETDGWLLRALKAEAANVQNLPPQAPEEDAFRPQAPRSLGETGLPPYQIESLILKYLLNAGVASGASVSDQIRIPFGLVDDMLREMKEDQLVVHRRSAGELGDFEYQLTDRGVEQAQRYSAKTTYYGSAPVPFEEFLAGVKAQSVNHGQLKSHFLKAAMAGLSLDATTLSRLGQAMTAGRSLFLYGDPGNGKTSIAERLTKAFGSSIWIPRSVMFEDDIVRVYDPIVHKEINTSGITRAAGHDQRWIQIERPTIIVGGELSMENLEITWNKSIGVLEAPIQMKSTCGTLVIDDFGRQRMRPDELLNRWIVPLEKQFDYLNLPSGKKVQVPFDQLLIFSTNIDPKDIVDEAFLRRIPYKIKVTDPSESQFRQLFEQVAGQYEVAFDTASLDHLIMHYFKQAGRPMRYCHPRDLVLQIRHLCDYHGLTREMTTEYMDVAASNYFTET